MKYLLDTNACIAAMKGTPAGVRIRLSEVYRQGSEVFVPSVVVFELWYGAAKSTRQVANFRKVDEFFAGPVGILEFDDEDAKRAGAVRAYLESVGKPIGAYDVLIAGQALRHGLTLVTANTGEFARVDELSWEDWAK